MLVQHLKPLKTGRVEGIIHVKSVEAQSNPVDGCGHLKMGIEFILNWFSSNYSLLEVLAAKWSRLWARAYSTSGDPPGREGMHQSKLKRPPVSVVWQLGEDHSGVVLVT
ncbi:hypothetical protein TNCV_4230161 [Trichonephila clavipes]|uniref:Uncharacterized protein n=1 Tax=Trichonephila clavipes TaxID=2585209 RepID=A0A8X6SM34_TRICX|nr:hypothetical protein TNCV_4230161 [Trichonephila clavipes]